MVDFSLSEEERAVRDNRPDARNIRTQAVKDGGDWVINGEKTWGPAALVFENVRVPERAMQWINNGRLMIPAGAIGSAERLLGQIGE
jgi:alkylation response protein AidB-like acyl-CoA dehydrogenase